jgi:AraC-type DNA-binding domain-containing proteins
MVVKPETDEDGLTAPQDLSEGTRPRFDLLSDQRTVGVTTIVALLSGTRAAGIDTADLLESSGIPASILDTKDGRISLRQWARLYQAAIIVTDDEALGLLQRPMAVGTFLMIARAFIHCKTIGDAMVRFVGFYNLLRTGMTYRFSANKRSATFSCEIDYPGAVRNSVVADFSLVSFHRLFSWLANELIELDAVTLAGPPPDYAAEYGNAFYHTPVQFNQPVHGISFSRAFMHLPIIRSEQNLEEYLTRFTTAMFLPLPKNGAMSRDLRAYMLEFHRRHGRLPDLAEAATHHAMPTRKFSRLLNNEGLGFREFKNRIQRDIAISYLTNSERSVEAISELSGFSEPSAFIRAFRSWTGTTPLAYRRAAASDLAH